MLRTLSAIVSAAFVAAFALCLSAVVSVVAHRALAPTHTPLMVMRAVQRRDAYPALWRWRPLNQISPHLVRAVIAAEDSGFCDHNGFDWEAIRKVLETLEEKGETSRGASTISMQTAKNVYLTQHRSYIRKGLEAGFTVLMEVFWTKHRIMEAYLNVAEWGPGIYGAEAAARTYFKRSAAQLTPDQAALMASTLPGPLFWQPNRPNRRIQRKARIIRKRMNAVRLGKDGVCGA